VFQVLDKTFKIDQYTYQPILNLGIYPSIFLFNPDSRLKYSYSIGLEAGKPFRLTVGERKMRISCSENKVQTLRRGILLWRNDS
jgi:hypothetical protein